MYVDAAATKGIGGYPVTTHFLAPNRRRSPYRRRCDGWSAYPHVDIAWVELLPAYVAINMFAARSPGEYFIMYSDNTHVVAWLSSRPPPFHLLDCIPPPIFMKPPDPPAAYFPSNMR